MEKHNPARLLFPLFGSLTLGLAPLLPEPHLVGKIRWVLGGAKGMDLVDWGDLAMHAAPWVWLGFTLTSVILARRGRARPP